MRRRIPFVLALLVFALACGKDSSPTAPTTTTTPPAPTSPRVTVFGVVSNAGGSPVPTASVTVSGAESTSGTTSTDGNGYYSVANIAAGNVTVRVTANGFADNSVTFAAQRDTQRDIALTSTARYAVFGNVRDANTNNPISGVRVGAVNVQTQTVVSTTTDGGGFYHLAGIASGPVTVDWTNLNYVSRSERLTIGSSDLRQDMTLTPRPPPAPQVEYRITGTARRCSVTYENAAGSVSQDRVTVPWSYTRSARTNDFLYVSCQIDTSGDTGNITVAIHKNGTLYRSANANGFPNIGTASGSY